MLSAAVKTIGLLLLLLLIMCGVQYRFCAQLVELVDHGGGLVEFKCSEMRNHVHWE